MVSPLRVIRALVALALPSLRRSHAATVLLFHLARGRGRS
jgi:hypothetical protein